VRVVITGASGNVGTSLVRALAADGDIDEIVGLARSLPAHGLHGVEWRTANIEHDDLVPLFRGADCVVHLAWGIQPSHDLPALRRTNVEGSRRVFRAVADADVPALVHASSVGAYSPGPKDRQVDESWPTEGTPTSFYARHKPKSSAYSITFRRIGRGRASSVCGPASSSSGARARSSGATSSARSSHVGSRSVA
jgi:nucleoside-diphosphate-sugar epimerase